MDLDSFFVSVERLKNKSLVGKPVIIGGKARRGVVASCSYEARAFGVHSAMAGYKARQLCPNAIFLDSDFSSYGLYSKMVTDVIEQEVPLFEKASIDEFYIDLTGMDKYFGCYSFAKQLREKIMTETNLPISFGLASNKVIAKMATNHAKPNGHLYIEHGQELNFIDKMPIQEIPMLGKQTVAFLNERGIQTIAELRAVGQVQLQSWLGKYGIGLWRRANGEGSVVLMPERERKSISKEHTFSEDVCSQDYLLAVLHQMIENLSHRLRLIGKKATSVTIKLRTPDFKTISKQITISPTYFEHEILPEVNQFFCSIYRKEPLRLIGIKLAGLTDVAHQATLFDNVEKQNDLYKSIDTLKLKFGRDKLNRATSLVYPKHKTRKP